MEDRDNVEAMKYFDMLRRRLIQNGKKGSKRRKYNGRGRSRS